MKALLLIALIMSGAANAKAVPQMTTLFKCSVNQNLNKFVLLDLFIQESTNGQTEAVLVRQGEDDITVKVKEMPSNGKTITFVGSDSTGKLKLSIGTRMVRVGKLEGRVSKLTVKPLFSGLDMVCAE